MNCLETKIRQNVFTCKPQFNYIEVGFTGVFPMRTTLPDDALANLCGCTVRFVSDTVSVFNLLVSSRMSFNPFVLHIIQAAASCSCSSSVSNNFLCLILVPGRAAVF